MSYISPCTLCGLEIGGHSSRWLNESRFGKAPVIHVVYHIQHYKYTPLATSGPSSEFLVSAGAKIPRMYLMFLLTHPTVMTTTKLRPQTSCRQHYSHLSTQRI